MIDYQPFLISNFRSGFNESVEPWLLPRDAYQKMVNAHLYRGVIEKIEGYTLYASMSNRNILHLNPAVDGVTKTFTGTLPTAPITTNFFGYGTIISGTSAETFTYGSDASSTVINLIGSDGGTGTLNLLTLLVTLTFNTAPPNNIYSTVFFSWDSATTGGPYAIMGIKQYYASNGSREILIFDQRRLGKIINIFGVISATAACLQGVSEIPHDYYLANAFTGDGTATYISGTNATALTTSIVPGTVKFFKYVIATGARSPSNALNPNQADVTDDGHGGLIGTGVVSGKINYITGAYTIVFTGVVANTFRYDNTSGVYGNLFTGSISNFFSLTNYLYNAFFTNDVDKIFYYDGTSIRYLNTNLSLKLTTSSSGVPTYDISTCLHVFAYRDRLLLLAPTVQSTLQQSGIWWSVISNPFDFTNDEFEIATTSESISAIGYITTNLIVRFSNSEKVFTYTGDAFAPFRFDSTNNIWACDAPYSSINYDSWFSSVGKPAIVASDGVNVKRVDEIIPDFTDPSVIAQQTPVPFMNQTSIQQCYGERFDDIKEGWLCYNSQPVDQSSVTASDNILAFNYLDGTYAIYDFPFSCLGFGKVLNVPTWGTTYSTWEDTSDTWGSYQLTNNALVDLAGDQFDKVYSLNTGNTKGDGVTPVLMDVISKNFSPFLEAGELSRLGYIDLFVSAYNESTLRVQFYINDELYIDSNQQPQGYYQETVLTFTSTDSMSPTQSQTKVWKRIYVGSVGKSHTVRFYQSAADLASNPDQPIYIHAMTLYMKPAGRVFN